MTGLRSTERKRSPASQANRERFDSSRASAATSARGRPRAPSRSGAPDATDHRLGFVDLERAAAEHHVLQHLDEDPAQAEQRHRAEQRIALDPHEALHPTLQLTRHQDAIETRLRRPRRPGAGAVGNRRVPRPHRLRQAARRRFPTCAGCPPRRASAPPGIRCPRRRQPPLRHCPAPPRRRTRYRRAPAGAWPRLRRAWRRATVAAGRPAQTQRPGEGFAEPPHGLDRHYRPGGVFEQCEAGLLVGCQLLPSPITETTNRRSG